MSDKLYSQWVKEGCGESYVSWLEEQLTAMREALGPEDSHQHEFPMMDVLIDGKLEQRQVSHLLPGAMPMHYPETNPDEEVLWVHGSTIPHIIKR